MQIRLLALLGCLLIAGMAQAADAGALAQRVDTAVRDCRAGDTLHVPLRSSGVDLVPLMGNGYQLKTAPDSLFDRKGLAVELTLENHLSEQLEAYLECTSPFMRLTQGQMELAAQVTSQDPRTKMVAIYQHGWSTGADTLVTRADIQDLADLSGATIALQRGGPQIDLLVAAVAAAKKQVESRGDSWQQPKLVYTDDQIGFADDTPGGRFFDDDGIDAVLVTRPDAEVLTSGGATGTGAEGSVKGASILFSTQAASTAMSEVYVVRADYLKAHQAQVKKFVSALFRAEVKTRENVKKLIVDWPAVAEHLLQDGAATDAAQTLWAQVETVGMQGNVNWADADQPRSFAKLNQELANTLVALGMLDSSYQVAMAGFDYAALAKGVFDKRRVSLPSFDTDQAAQMVEDARSSGDLDRKTIAQFEINFKPNQSDFPVSEYGDAFTTIINAAAKYGGAIFTVTGHADPLRYLKLKSKGASLSSLRTIRQAARNLSLKRAIAVRNTIIEFADAQDVSMDMSQFVTEGVGFTNPKTGICGDDPCPPKTEEQWLSNMRVTFRAIVVSPESSAFTPPNSW